MTVESLFLPVPLRHHGSGSLFFFILCEENISTDNDGVLGNIATQKGGCKRYSNRVRKERKWVSTGLQLADKTEPPPLPRPAKHPPLSRSQSIDIFPIGDLSLTALVTCQDDRVQELLTDRLPIAPLPQQRLDGPLLGPSLLLGHLRQICCGLLATPGVLEFNPNPMTTNLLLFFVSVWGSCGRRGRSRTREEGRGLTKKRVR